MPSLPESLATPEAKAPYVRRLFATIADRYDLITRLLSYGRDAAWKRRLVAMSEAGHADRALDLACGTGDIAFGLAERGARVTGLDLTIRMLQLARAKMPGRPRVAYLAGDMMTLPFGDAQFDLVTAGYGLRNVPRLEPAIAEIHRVLRPGGRLLSLDFNRPANPVKRGIYLVYLTAVGSTLGWILHRDPDTYRYIPESIKRYPGADGVASILERSGFQDCGVVSLLGGFMAINVARKAAASVRLQAEG
ncbi:MAG TPA: ubiquinone/menaquinone biosynthesis methyltransferase [Vicinamibacterales bacterium]|jgi:demethylmenaquinone methyltransferase/2-methoxy-6-polyprenyl-1,4-benzoquinol methylase|nr:ubiquinone/menaquinone biosynthesis methyltransferase [Vicinamibacterales bacterium]